VYEDEVGQGSMIEGDKLPESPPEQVQVRTTSLISEAQPSFSFTVTPNTPPIQTDNSPDPVLAVDSLSPQSPHQNGQSQSDSFIQTDSVSHAVPPRPGRRIPNRMPGGFHDEEEEEASEPRPQTREERNDHLFLAFLGRMKKRIMG